MADEKIRAKSILMSPDDFEKGQVVTPFDMSERSHGLLYEVLAIDCPNLLLRTIYPDKRRSSPTTADIRFDCFRRVSSDYVDALKSFEVQAVSEEASSVMPLPPLSDRYFGIGPKTNSFADMKYDVVIEDVGDDVSQVALAIIQNTTQCDRDEIVCYLESAQDEYCIRGVTIVTLEKLVVALQQAGASVFARGAEDD